MLLIWSAGAGRKGPSWLDNQLPMYVATTIAEPEKLLSIRQDWQRLVQGNDAYTLFNSFEWCWSWINHYWKEHYQLHVVVISHKGTVIAILPLYIQTMANSCHFLGTGEAEIEEVCSEYLDFILARRPLEPAKLYAQIQQCIAALDDRRFILANVLEDSHVLQVLGNYRKTIVLECGRQYALSIGNSYEKTIAALSGKQSKRARYLLNIFSKDPTLEFVPFAETDFVNNWENLKDVHQAEWLEKGLPGALNSDVFNNFHAYMAEHFPEVRQTFSVLKKNGSVLSIHHYYVYNGRYHFYLTGTKKSVEARLSPGTLLHHLCLRHMKEPGMIYDLLRGKEEGSYKAKFCSKGKKFYTILVFEAGLLGSACYLLERIKNKWTKQLRDFLAS